MNAIQFIQKHGVDKARKVVEGAPERATHLHDGEYVRVSDPRWILDGYVLIDDLKRLVESVDKVNSCGGLHGLKTYCNGDYSQNDLQAIADYEAIGGEHV